MRILFLTSGYPPWSVAGTEVSTAAVASALAAAGQSVTVACAGNWDSGAYPLNGSDTSVQDGVTVVRLHLNWKRGPDPNRYLFDNPVTAQAVGELIDRLRPDVVHATSCYTLSASVLREVQARSLPLVVTLTDYWFVCPRVNLLRSNGTICGGRTTPAECLDCMLGDSRVYRRLRERVPTGILHALTAEVVRRPQVARLYGFRGRALDFATRKRLLKELLASADMILAPTRALADRYSEIGFDTEIRLWRFGHDLGWVERLERRPRDGRLVFGFVGRIAEEKGVHVLIEAATQLNAFASTITVDVWGDPGQEPAYTARCESLLTTGGPVRFRGRFSRDHMTHVYGGIDVLVVPSIWDENSPLVVQEAFAAHVPVIASDVVGLREVVVDGKDGLLVPPDDPVALASTMRLLAEDSDRLTMLRSGFRPVRSADAAAAELQDIYTGLVDGAS